MAHALAQCYAFIVKKLVHRPGQRRKRKSEGGAAKASKQGKAKEAKEAAQDTATTQ
jgi:hypothetical protein